MKKKIHSKVELIEESKTHMNTIRIRHIGERKGVFIDIDDIEDDVEKKRSFSAHESYLKVSSWLIEGQIYTALAMEDILARRFERF